MSFLRWCGSIRSVSSSKVFISSLQNRLNSVGLRSFKNVPSQAKICQPQQKLSPLVIKCSILGVSGYLCVRYLDLKSFLPTAYCREASQDHSRQFQIPEGNGEGAKNGEANGKKAEDTFPIRQFLSLLVPHLGYLIVAIVSALASAYLNIEIPQSLGRIVNVVASFVGTGETGRTDSSQPLSDFLNQIRGPAIDMVKMYLAQAFLTFTYIYSLACVGERMASELRKNLFQSILHQDVAFFDTHRAGEINSRLSNDVQEFKSAFKHCISQGLRCSAQVIGSACAIYRISPEMTGMMLIVVPSVIAVGTFFGSFLRAISKMAQAQTAKAAAVSDECVANIRTVRAFAMEGSASELYEKEIDESGRLHEWLGLGIGIFQGGTNLFLNGVVLGTLYYGGYLLSVERVTPGDLMSFLVATQTIQRSIAQMSLLFGHFVRGMSSGARIFEYINLKPTIRTSGGKTIPYHSFFGDIEFKNVSFTYPTRPDQIVVENLSLSIKGGQMVALVGTSGGGKSTLAALLERFYDVTKGQITFDGIDIKELDPNWLRGKAIGYINQEPVLFATSVLENIRYGRPSATDQEVIEAAKAANAHQFITNFPKGYQTVVGERGVTVSGGQKQRIAIARALLKNPAILILDEATSALDAESEKLVQEALDQVCKNRTVLVIAHRLSTIKNADVIAVVSQGRIVEKGTHQQLKKANGVYSFLIKHQELPA